MAARNAFLKEAVLKNKSQNSGIVKVVWHVEGEEVEGRVVKEVADSSVYIKAIFTRQALDAFVTNYDDSFDSPPDWSHSMLVLNRFHVQFQSSAHPDNSEKKARFVLVVEKFGLFNLQKGFYTKHQPKDLMTDPEVEAKAQEMERRERDTRSVVEGTSETIDSSPSLSMLLDQMGQADSGPNKDSSYSHSQDLSESPQESQEGEMTEEELAAEEKMRCLKSEDFIISADQQAVLDSIPEWKDDYIPPAESSDDASSSLPMDKSLELCTLACDRHTASPEPSSSKIEVNSLPEPSLSKTTQRDGNASLLPSPFKSTALETNISLQPSSFKTTALETNTSLQPSSFKTTQHHGNTSPETYPSQTAQHQTNNSAEPSSLIISNSEDYTSLTLSPSKSTEHECSATLQPSKTCEYNPPSHSTFNCENHTALARSSSKAIEHEANTSIQSHLPSTSNGEATTNKGGIKQQISSTRSTEHSDNGLKETNIILRPSDQEKISTETLLGSGQEANAILHENNQDPALAETTSETDKGTSSKAVTPNKGEQQSIDCVTETNAYTLGQVERLNDEVRVEEGREPCINSILETKSHSDMQGESLSDGECFEGGRKQTKTHTDMQGERLEDAVCIGEGRQQPTIGDVEETKLCTDRQGRRLTDEENAEHRQNFADGQLSSNIHTASTQQDGVKNDIVPDTSDSSKSSCEGSFQHPEMMFTISSPSSPGNITSSAEDPSLPVPSHQSAVGPPPSPPIHAPPSTSSCGHSEPPPPPVSSFHQLVDPPPPHFPPPTGPTPGDGHAAPSRTGTCSLQGQESEKSVSSHRSPITSNCELDPDTDMSHPLSLGFMPSGFTTQTILPDLSSLNSSGGESEVMTGAGSRGRGGVVEENIMQASQGFVPSDKKLQELVPDQSFWSTTDDSQGRNGGSGSCSGAALSNTLPVDMPHHHSYTTTKPHANILLPHTHTTKTLPANTPNTVIIPHHHPHNTTTTTANTNHSISSTPAHSRTKDGRQLRQGLNSDEDVTLRPVDSPRHVIYHSTQNSQSEESQSPSILDMSAIQPKRPRYVSVVDADESEYLRLTQFTSTQTDIDHVEFDLTSGKELTSSFPLQFSADSSADLQFSTDSNYPVQSPEPESRDGVLAEECSKSSDYDSFDRNLVKQANTAAEGDSEGHYGSSGEIVAIPDSLQEDVVVISSCDSEGHYHGSSEIVGIPDPLQEEVVVVSSCGSNGGAGCSTSTQDPESYTAVSVLPPNSCERNSSESNSGAGNSTTAHQPDCYAAIPASPPVGITSIVSSGGTGSSTSTQDPDYCTEKSAHPSVVIISSESSGGAGCGTTSQEPNCSVKKCVDPTATISSTDNSVGETSMSSQVHINDTTQTDQAEQSCLTNTHKNVSSYEKESHDKENEQSISIDCQKRSNNEPNREINCPIISNKTRLNNDVTQRPSKRNIEWNTDINSPVLSKKTRLNNAVAQSPSKQHYLHSKTTSTRMEKDDDNITEIQTPNVRDDGGARQNTLRTGKQLEIESRKRVTNSPNTMLTKQSKSVESRCVRPQTLEEDSDKNCSDAESFSSDDARLSGEWVLSRQKEIQSRKRPTEKSVRKNKSSKERRTHNDQSPDITRKSPDVFRQTTTSGHPVMQTDRQRRGSTLGQIYKTKSKHGSGLSSRNDSISRQSSRNKHTSAQSSAISTDSSSTEFENDAMASDSHWNRDHVKKTSKKTSINKTVSGDGSSSDCLYTSEQHAGHIEQSPNTAKKRTSRIKHNGVAANKDTRTVLSKHKHKTNTSTRCSPSRFKQNIRRRKLCKQPTKQYSDSSDEDSDFELSTRQNSDISDHDSTCRAPFTTGTTRDQTDANSPAVRDRNNLQARMIANISAWQDCVIKSKDPKQKMLRHLKLTQDLLKKVEDSLARPNIRC